MPDIARVDMLDSDTLEVQLSNGTVVLLCIGPILTLPGFARLIEDDRVLYPKTDGKTVYWRDGPRPIPLAELMELSFQTEKEEEKR